ncbi:MAG: hypothetical protein CSA32_04660 [Desulfobulbus propionicus]|nr:MAG: hypothetical protein CSA32_04660 [Desulfobulbus propionicus]
MISYKHITVRRVYTTLVSLAFTSVTASGYPDAGKRDWQLSSLYAACRDRPKRGNLEAVAQKQRVTITL